MATPRSLNLDPFSITPLDIIGRGREQGVAAGAIQIALDRWQEDVIAQGGEPDAMLRAADQARRELRAETASAHAGPAPSPATPALVSSGAFPASTGTKPPPAPAGPAAPPLRPEAHPNDTSSPLPRSASGPLATAPPTAAPSPAKPASYQRLRLPDPDGPEGTTREVLVVEGFGPLPPEDVDFYVRPGLGDPDRARIFQEELRLQQQETGPPMVLDAVGGGERRPSRRQGAATLSGRAPLGPASGPQPLSQASVDSRAAEITDLRRSLEEEAKFLSEEIETRYLRGDLSADAATREQKKAHRDLIKRGRETLNAHLHTATTDFLQGRLSFRQASSLFEAGGHAPEDARKALRHAGVFAEHAPEARRRLEPIFANEEFDIAVARDPEHPYGSPLEGIPQIRILNRALYHLTNEEDALLREALHFNQTVDGLRRKVAEAALDALDGMPFTPEEKEHFIEAMIVAKVGSQEQSGRDILIATANAPEKRAPFVGGLFSAKELVPVVRVVDKIHRGEAPSAVDDAVILAFYRRSQRDSTLMAAALDLAFEMPGLAAEVGTTGGASTLGREIAEEALQKAGSKALVRMVTEYLARHPRLARLGALGAEGVVVGAGVLSQTPVAFGDQILAGTYQRHRIPDIAGFQGDTAAWALGPTQSLPWALAASYSEGAASLGAGHAVQALPKTLGTISPAWTRAMRDSAWLEHAEPFYRLRPVRLAGEELGDALAEGALLGTAHLATGGEIGAPPGLPSGESVILGMAGSGASQAAGARFSGARAAPGSPGSPLPPNLFPRPELDLTRDWGPDSILFADDPLAADGFGGAGLLSNGGGDGFGFGATGLDPDDAPPDLAGAQAYFREESARLYRQYHELYRDPRRVRSDRRGRAEMDALTRDQADPEAARLRLLHAAFIAEMTRQPVKTVWADYETLRDQFGLAFYGRALDDKALASQIVSHMDAVESHKAGPQRAGNFGPAGPGGGRATPEAELELVGAGVRTQVAAAHRAYRGNGATSTVMASGSPGADDVAGGLGDPGGTAIAGAENSIGVGGATESEGAAGEPATSGPGGTGDRGLPPRPPGDGVGTGGDGDSPDGDGDGDEAGGQPTPDKRSDAAAPKPPVPPGKQIRKRRDYSKLAPGEQIWQDAPDRPGYQRRQAKVAQGKTGEAIIGIHGQLDLDPSNSTVMRIVANDVCNAIDVVHDVGFILDPYIETGFLEKSHAQWRWDPGQPTATIKLWSETPIPRVALTHELAHQFYFSWRMNLSPKMKAAWDDLAAELRTAQHLSELHTIKDSKQREAAATDEELFCRAYSQMIAQEHFPREWKRLRETMDDGKFYWQVSDEEGAKAWKRVESKLQSLLNAYDLQ